MASKLISIDSDNLRKVKKIKVSDDVEKEEDAEIEKDNDDNDNNNNNKNERVTTFNNCINDQWRKCILVDMLYCRDIQQLRHLAFQCYKTVIECDCLPPFDNNDPNKDREVCEEEFTYVIEEGNKFKIMSFVFFCLWIVPEVRVLFCPSNPDKPCLTNPSVLHSLINGYTLQQLTGDRKLIKPLDGSMTRFLMGSNPVKDAFTMLVQEVGAELIGLGSWENMDTYANPDPEQASDQIMAYITETERHLKGVKDAKVDEEKTLALEPASVKPQGNNNNNNNSDNPNRMIEYK